ncbi:hypothetical protein [Hahella ganghwensis]|uniref:hypothetical protein n=1 Tax=Hahella ganghwensis TaxID=286420 RepID=UPI00037DD51F|nr:hypothetical protein [Hahella ganghwensis]
MRKFKHFLSKSVSSLFVGSGAEGVDHLEDYLLKDIGLERIGRRVQPIEKDLTPSVKEINPVKRVNGEDPPM